MLAAFHIGPLPSGIRTPNFVRRRNRFRPAPDETQPEYVKARRCRGNRSPALPSAAHAAGAPPLSRLAGAEIRGASLFNDLVGAGEDRGRDCETKVLRGLEIDDQLEGRRLLDRQIGRLGALQNLSGVNANQAKGSYEVQSIADQAASFDELARLVDRRNAVGCRQRHELLAPVGKERVTADNEPAGM